MISLEGIYESNDLYPIVPLFFNKKTPVIKWGNNDNWKYEYILNTYQTWVNNKGESSTSKTTGCSIITGEVSSIMVLDVDNKLDKKGSETLNKVLKDLEIDKLDTLTVKTPNDGYHYYFRYEKGFKTIADILDGIDFRADGGLIVAPGSTYEPSKEELKKGLKKGTYEVVNDVPISNVPIELGNYIKSKLNNTKKASGNKPLFRQITDGSRNDQLFKQLINLAKLPTCRTYESLMYLARAINGQADVKLDDNELEGRVNSVLNYKLPFYYDENKKFSNSSYAEYITSEHDIKTSGKTFFKYDPDDKYYKTQSIDDLEMFLYHEIKTNEKENGIEPTKKRIDDIINNMKYEAFDGRIKNNIIVCNNGMYDVLEDRLLDFDKNIFAITRIYTDYNKDAYKKFKGSLLEKTLMEIFSNEDDIEVFQMICGMALMPNASKFKKCIYLLGSGRNGKGLLISLLVSLLNEDKKVLLPFHNMDGAASRFGLSKLHEGISVIYDTDNKNVILNETDNFKKLIVGEPIEVDKKHKDSITLVPNALMLYGCNSMPVINESNNAIYNRMTILKCTKNIFGNAEEVKNGKANMLADNERKDKIMSKEIDMFLSWAIEGLRKCIKSDYTLPITEAQREMLEEYELNNDSILNFLNDEEFKITKSKEDKIRITLRELYLKYSCWCIENGRLAKSQNNFKAKLQELGVEINKQVRINGLSVKGVSGIKYEGETGIF